MAVNSNIEWCDATWNPTRGCSRVSAGCQHCYAERQALRHAGPGGHYEGLLHSSGAWNGTVRFVPGNLDLPLRWRKPRRVFVNSMSDLFHEAILDEFLARIFVTMIRAPHHQFIALTKRPDRMREAMEVRIQHAIHAHCLLPSTAYCGAAWPPPNVVLGVSAEDQASADARIQLLLQTPAAVRLVSLEPLLGPVGLRREWITDVATEMWQMGDPLAATLMRQSVRDGSGWMAPILDWVIVGSESGHGARPMNIDWARYIVDQCAAAGVACFVKQIANAHDRKGGNPEHWPDGHWPREFPRLPDA